MDIREVFEIRRSVRKFKNAPVPDRFIEDILYAASLAPSARNVQPWEFIVTRDPVLIQDLAAIVSPNGAFLAHASVCLSIFCRDTKYYLEDGCAATTQALLCASMLGLGACWIAGDKKDYCPKVKVLLGVPEALKLVSLIALGFPDESPRSPKKEWKLACHKERYSP